MSDPISGEATSAAQPPNQGVEQAILSASASDPKSRHRRPARDRGLASQAVAPASGCSRRRDWHWPLHRRGDRHRPVRWRWENRRRRARQCQRHLAGNRETAVALAADTGERHARLRRLFQYPRVLRYGTLRRPASKPAGREHRSDAGHGLLDAGRRYAGAGQPPGDASRGAGEGGCRLRRDGRGGSRLHQRLARKRKQLVWCRRELVRERHAGRVLGETDHHRRHRQARRRPLAGLLRGKAARECAVQSVYGALLGGALRPGFDVHGTAIGRTDRRARAEPVRDRRPAGAAAVWRDAGDAGVRREHVPGTRRG